MPLHKLTHWSDQYEIIRCLRDGQGAFPKRQHKLKHLELSNKSIYMKFGMPSSVGCCWGAHVLEYHFVSLAHPLAENYPVCNSVFVKLRLAGCRHSCRVTWRNDRVEMNAILRTFNQAPLNITVEYTPIFQKQYSGGMWVSSHLNSFLRQRRLFKRTPSYGQLWEAYKVERRHMSPYLISAQTRIQAKIKTEKVANIKSTGFITAKDNRKSAVMKSLLKDLKEIEHYMHQ